MKAKIVDKKTSLNAAHIAAGGKMVSFGGWNMPVNYGNQVDEHHIVRNDAGMFDVSHMTVVDITGEQAQAFLRKLLANDVIKLTKSGKALYSCMLTPEGGVVDDLIVYYIRNDFYRMVVNAATREKDLAWIHRYADLFQVSVKERDDLSMIAVQGPKARVAASTVVPEPQKALDLGVFVGAFMKNDTWFVARTGYTGEDGFEIMMPNEQAEATWNQLLKAGVKPCGLGARDTLRLEAGMNLYGHDMDETVNPRAAGLSWTLAMDPPTRDFVGRKAVEGKADEKLVGLVLQDKGVPREGYIVHTETGDGVITSGTFSPTLERGIALARVPAATGDNVMVQVRKKNIPAKVVRPPFVRNGKAKIDI